MPFYRIRVFREVSRVLEVEAESRHHAEMAAINWLDAQLTVDVLDDMETLTETWDIDGPVDDEITA